MQGVSSRKTLSGMELSDSVACLLLRWFAVSQGVTSPAVNTQPVARPYGSTGQSRGARGPGTEARAIGQWAEAGASGLAWGVELGMRMG